MVGVEAGVLAILGTGRNTAKRVKFDFEVDFSNGGGIQGQDFRLDIEGEDIGDEELADYIVRDMRLLMVSEVRILNKEIIEEEHKRTGDRRPQTVDLSHTVEDGMITYKGLPAPIICDYLSREESREHYAPGTEFQIGRITMVSMAASRKLGIQTSERIREFVRERPTLLLPAHDPDASRRLELMEPVTI